MKWHTLIAIEDVNIGSIGLVLKKMDLSKIVDGQVYAIFEGFTLAHDLLEHVNGINKIGSIDDELEALGAMWYTRGQFGYLNETNYYDPSTTIAAEVTNLAELFISGVDFVNPHKKTKDHKYDLDFIDIIEKSKKEFIEEDRRKLSKFYAAAIHYLRSGFRKAEQRYKNADAANYLFYNIKTVFDKAMKNTDLYPGMEFRIGYTLDGRVIFKDPYGEIYYEQK